MVLGFRVEGSAVQGNAAWGSTGNSVSMAGARGGGGGPSGSGLWSCFGDLGLHGQLALKPTVQGLGPCTLAKPARKCCEGPCTI